MEQAPITRKSPKYTITLPPDVDNCVQAEVVAGRLGGKASRIIAKRLREAYAIKNTEEA